jgi:hypothetical protein
MDTLNQLVRYALSITLMVPMLGAAIHEFKGMQEGFALYLPKNYR